MGRGVVLSTLGNLFPPLAGLVSAPILAQSLGVVGRGEVAAATAPLFLALVGLTLGLPEGLTYFVARNQGHPSRLLQKGLLLLSGVGIIGTALVILAAPVLSGRNDALSGLIIVASFALVPSLLLGGLRGFAAGRQSWGLIAIERLVSSSFRLGLILYLALTNTLNPLNATISIAVSTFAGIVVYVGLLLKKQRSRKALSIEPAPLLGFGLRVWVGALSGVLLARLDQALMTPLAGAYELGIYAVAVSLGEVALVFNRAVRDVVFSVESSERNDERLGSASRISTLLTALGTCFIGLACFWGIPTLFGVDFTPAIPVTLLLLVAVFLGNPGSVAGAGLSARGRPGLRSTSLLIAVTLNILVIFLLVPAFGAMGAALATLLGNVVAGYMNIFWLWKIFRIPPKVFLGIRKSDLELCMILVRRRLPH
jgi:O-antigen/teichoic acid export membrane protein